MKNVYLDTISDTDSYKFQHFNMYPEEVNTTYSYFEARQGAEFPVTKFFGLQYVLSQFEQVTLEQLEEAYEMSVEHGVPLNKKGFERLIEKHNGQLPVIIKAVPEGSIIPISNVLMTIQNMDEEFPWLPNYLETMLSRVWYPTTVCTLSYWIKQMLLGYANKTADSTNFVNFQLHDFGSRGVTCREQAGIGGMAHLVNFKGTDTGIAMKYARKHYNAPKACGYSVLATEHSIMTALGEEGEKIVFETLLDKYPNGILSVVIDSYNWDRFIDEYARDLKYKIMSRNGVTVFRPDSGDPISITLKVITLLDDIFGHIYNKKNYKVLNTAVRMLWGDGLELEDIRNICEALIREGYSTENIVFGMGGGLLQKVNRDTNHFGFKCSAMKFDDTWHDIQKNPINKGYFKGSKKGTLKLVCKAKGEFSTVQDNDPTYFGFPDVLQTVFNKEIIKRYTWEEVKNNGSIHS